MNNNDRQGVGTKLVKRKKSEMFWKEDNMSRNSVERCLYFCSNASCAGDVVASIQLATSPKRLIQIRTAFLRIENSNTSKQHIFPFGRPVVVPAIIFYINK